MVRLFTKSRLSTLQISSVPGKYFFFFYPDGWGGVKLNVWGGIEVEEDGVRAGEAERLLDFGAMSPICFYAGEAVKNANVACLE